MKGENGNRAGEREEGEREKTVVLIGKDADVSKATEIH